MNFLPSDWFVFFAFIPFFTGVSWSRDGGQGGGKES